MKNDIYSEEFIHNLLESSNASAHLKDVSTGKYLDSNDINVRKFGLEKGKDIVGLTIDDLDLLSRGRIIFDIFRL